MYNNEGRTKSMVLAVAFIMLAVGFMALVHTSDSSDAAPSGTYTQNINVYYYDDDLSDWDVQAEQKYNLYDAIVSASGYFGYSVATATGNNSWVNGYNPNEFHGIITQVSNSTAFSIYAYDGSAWIDVTGAPLGWIRPFSDYGATVVIPGLGFSASANVAIVLSGQSASTLPTANLQTMPSVAGYTNTLYKFTLQDLTYTGSGTGISFTDMTVKTSSSATSYSLIGNSAIQGQSLDVYGYGSDAYLALMDALGASLVSDNTVSVNSDQIYSWVGHNTYVNGVYQYSYNTYYSWMGSMFGYGTFSGSGTYTYWGSYYTSQFTPGNLWTGYLDYNLGYYSQLAGAYNTSDGEFTLVYMVS